MFEPLGSTERVVPWQRAGRRDVEFRFAGNYDRCRRAGVDPPPESKAAATDGMDSGKRQRRGQPNWTAAGCGSPNGRGNFYRLTEVRYGRCSADLQVGTLLKTKCAGLKPGATTPGDELGLRWPVKSTANDFFWNKATDLVENKGSR